MRVQFCPNCSRIIAFEFRFCPWCGTWAHDSITIPDAIEQSFKKLERFENDRIVKEIDKMDRTLAELERDLDLMVEQGEKEHMRP